MANYKRKRSRKASPRCVICGNQGWTGNSLKAMNGWSRASVVKRVVAQRRPVTDGWA